VVTLTLTTNGGMGELQQQEGLRGNLLLYYDQNVIKN
jgi:hypothetical protein